MWNIRILLLSSLHKRNRSMIEPLIWRWLWETWTFGGKWLINGGILVWFRARIFWGGRFLLKNFMKLLFLILFKVSTHTFNPFRKIQGHLMLKCCLYLAQKWTLFAIVPCETMNKLFWDTAISGLKVGTCLHSKVCLFMGAYNTSTPLMEKGSRIMPTRHASLYTNTQLCPWWHVPV